MEAKRENMVDNFKVMVLNPRTKEVQEALDREKGMFSHTENLTREEIKEKYGIDIEMKTIEIDDYKRHLYGWLFTYNPYTNLHLATDRDNYDKLFTSQADPHILKSHDRESLEYMIMINEGKMEKILNWQKTWDN